MKNSASLDCLLSFPGQHISRKCILFYFHIILVDFHFLVILSKFRIFLHFDEIWYGIFQIS